ncbi:MlaE family lipid ABC transporter permease subunit [Altererythrobacter luteolus]|uniref:MlaE family lipid ABC transporter permease subunit n=1 Tax=Pontixanthobacter luteolus TaxID=295089 RepID=A0A6I4V3C4_9SPHN|nr:ABC transporter permease [Pontixanthobacter luteolus]MXP47290.1 MlaE family lipid ABC transporter permease subunit [Pontixanthobacter luteolus]
MDNGAHFSIEERAESGPVLALTGAYLVSTIGEIDADLRDVDGDVGAVDLSGVTAIDTVGAWIAARLSTRLGVPIVGAGDRASRLLKEIESANEVEPEATDLRPGYERAAEHVGVLVEEFVGGIKGVVGFLGQTLIAVGQLLRSPRLFRGKAVVRQLDLVGIRALPIVGLMSFLIGIVIAQQGAVQLAQFGAETLTVNLVGRITLRELGVLMTAIMIAGRSGSAFAAQIGTMKLTEEVDAMRTIGISPLQALVIPRILSAVLMMPLLGFYSSVVAIVGGAVVADLSLGIPFLTFLERIKEVVPLYDLWVGLIKAPVFGLIIGIAGCYHGMQVAGDSEQVGRRTTMAVVSAIFMVIVLDAFFAVFFTEIGWG